MRTASTRAIDTVVLVNCRPALTCPVSGVRAVETKGRAMAFFVSFTPSSISIAPSRPMPRKRWLPPIICCHADWQQRGVAPAALRRVGAVLDRPYRLQALSVADSFRPCAVQRAIVTPSA